MNTDKRSRLGGPYGDVRDVLSVFIFVHQWFDTLTGYPRWSKIQRSGVGRAQRNTEFYGRRGNA